MKDEVKTPRAAGRPRRILVVEDEAVTSMMIEDIVEKLGCIVVGPAAAVNEAMKLADAGELDGAVLDFNLNGQIVYPVADRLAARHVPFVFLTAYGAQVVPPAHADRQVLQKPFSPAELTRLLAQEFALNTDLDLAAPPNHRRSREHPTAARQVEPGKLS